MFFGQYEVVPGCVMFHGFLHESSMVPFRDFDHSAEALLLLRNLGRLRLGATSASGSTWWSRSIHSTTMSYNGRKRAREGDIVTLYI